MNVQGPVICPVAVATARLTAGIIRDPVAVVVVVVYTLPLNMSMLVS